jgi:hypothetical protein
MMWNKGGLKGGDFTEEENENIYIQNTIATEKGALNDIYLPFSRNEASLS